ncbi:hypothetical protein L9F63_024051, partial [Diploptera punctata]
LGCDRVIGLFYVRNVVICITDMFRATTKQPHNACFLSHNIWQILIVRRGRKSTNEIK